MARRKKSDFPLLKILVMILIMSLFLFGVVIFEKNNPNVRGVMTDSNSSFPRTSTEGDACGTSIGIACRKDLVCAPFAGSSNQSDVANLERRCLGKPEASLPGGCSLFIPGYGACVREGVWPLPVPTIISEESSVPPATTTNDKPSPIPTPTTRPTSYQKMPGPTYLPNVSISPKPSLGGLPALTPVGSGDTKPVVPLATPPTASPIETLFDAIRRLFGLQ